MRSVDDAASPSSGTAPVAAIVVTFNPKLEAFAEVIAAVREQVSRVVIVDNGSVPETARELRSLADASVCEFVGLAENLGIATAQNRGIEVVLRDVCSLGDAARHYVLFLDHDSIAERDMVAQLLEVDRQARARGVAVGAVGPLIVDRRTGTSGRVITEGHCTLRRVACPDDAREIEAGFLISSGTLVRTDTLQQIGGMRDGLFIDHVDTEWCLRARAQQWRMFVACRARLVHSLGDEVVAVWMGRRREVFVHSPLRDYYMCRNTILLLRTTRMSFAWRIFLILRLIASISFFGLCVPPRVARLRRMASGMVHGWLEREGKAPP